MIAIYRLTAGGAVERAATATSAAEALAHLAAFHCPAVAYDGHEAVGATGHTRAVDLAAITAHAQSLGGDTGASSCVAPGCVMPRARANFRTAAHLVALCLLHRRRACACRGLDKADPAAVAAYLSRGAPVP